MNKEKICTRKEVDLDKKERDMIGKMVLQWRLEYANVDGKIIRKTDLKNQFRYCSKTDYTQYSHGTCRR